MSRSYRLDVQSDIVGEVYETEDIDVYTKNRETSNPKVYIYFIKPALQYLCWAQLR